MLIRFLVTKLHSLSEFVAMTDMYFKVIWNSLFLVLSEIPPPT